MTKRAKSAGLPIGHARAAAIDIGSRFHVAAVPPECSDDPVQTFQAFTGDLHRMAQWLVALGIKTVAMESTGVYWVPVYEVLESAGLEVVVANAREARAVPGRKSDVNDAQWLQRLHACGLPATVTGVTGLKIVRAIAAGERDTKLLASMHYRLLLSRQGARLWQIVASGSPSQRIARAIEWLRYAEPLRVGELAARAQMSASSFHHNFRLLTAMSPLQFQKWLRLNEARRLMLMEHMDAAVAGFQVGYESPSQFSREYSRLFGAPPLRDIRRIQLVAEPAAERVAA